MKEKSIEPIFTVNEVKALLQQQRKLVAEFLIPMQSLQSANNLSSWEYTRLITAKTNILNVREPELTKISKVENE